ncbi:3,4-dihydroxy-2-butanone-4-phosphate synthase [Betaproteobacteria bacterium]|nr:3,4-dihydroxy-2-butanone-4-phosphate synthase [Betaproteobacteria bacterium]GHT92759.1 3,4-dihydroxy-2-butanone-4-phosphate synthase [Betaproteobacteria bacterium]GHU00296.1 3,4-dihydroxy-2-butanone-4-phosphate synthase [Betaproteobacteria bacterium]GHU04167.1 3,4-dihydroxy-2-butanone-4-phosphate synthase [Betaproteobacteria bacterium]GHU13906.1 3,4-dihydroxy-2-butanone-4-phosphate synthase [Betaproteobacteria bacterium]
MSAQLHHIPPQQDSGKISALSPISEIIDEIRAGHIVILVDDEDRENEGDLLMAAEFVTPEAINFMVTHGRGLVCLTLTAERCAQLGLEQMVRDNRAPHGTAFTASIEAATGVTTGISAHDRARTVQVAVARNARPEDIVAPGHIFPLTAQRGGVLIRAGHTEAGCDLTQLAGLEPAAVICEVLKEDGTMARLPDLVEFGKTHGIKIGAIRDLIEYRAATEHLVEQIATKEVTTPHGRFQLTAFEDKTSGDVHFALSHGEIRPERETLVRVHEPVAFVDFLDPASGAHTFPINDALASLAKAEAGVIVLLYRPQSGHELLARLTGEGLPPTRWDGRLFGIGAQILRNLKVGKMRVLASPRKMPSMAGFGLEITGFTNYAN